MFSERSRQLIKRRGFFVNLPWVEVFVVGTCGRMEEIVETGEEVEKLQ